jgi:hypothetical protein
VAENEVPEKRRKISNPLFSTDHRLVYITRSDSPVAARLAYCFTGNLCQGLGMAGFGSLPPDDKYTLASQGIPGRHSIKKRNYLYAISIKGGNNESREKTHS